MRPETRRVKTLTLATIEGALKSARYEMDEVLFRLAFLLTSVKKEDQAREFFHRLIKDYPNSKYIPDAYLSFAEYYFDLDCIPEDCAWQPRDFPGEDSLYIWGPPVPDDFGENKEASA